MQPRAAAGSSGTCATQRSADERPELLAAEPINVYHWAAVALVTALMCVVMACAAGTPGLARAASVTSFDLRGAGRGACAWRHAARDARAPLAIAERVHIDSPAS